MFKQVGHTNKDSGAAGHLLPWPLKGLFPGREGVWAAHSDLLTFQRRLRAPPSREPMSKS